MLRKISSQLAWRGKQRQMCYCSYPTSGLYWDTVKFKCFISNPGSSWRFCCPSVLRSDCCGDKNDGAFMTFRKCSQTLENWDCKGRWEAASGLFVSGNCYGIHPLTCVQQDKLLEQPWRWNHNRGDNLTSRMLFLAYKPGWPFLFVCFWSHFWLVWWKIGLYLATQQNRSGIPLTSYSLF